MVVTEMILWGLLGVLLYMSGAALSYGCAIILVTAAINIAVFIRLEQKQYERLQKAKRNIFANLQKR